VRSHEKPRMVTVEFIVMWVSLDGLFRRSTEAAHKQSSKVALDFPPATI
jgi:hypothetical protein